MPRCASPGLALRPRWRARSATAGSRPASCRRRSARSAAPTCRPAPCASSSIWWARGDQPRSANHFRNGSGSTAAAVSGARRAWLRHALRGSARRAQAKHNLEQNVIKVVAATEPGWPWAPAPRKHHEPLHRLRRDPVRIDLACSRPSNRDKPARSSSMRRAHTASRMRVAARGAQDEGSGPSCASTEKANSPPGASAAATRGDDAVERADIHEDVGGGDEIGLAWGSAAVCRSALASRS